MIATADFIAISDSLGLQRANLLALGGTTPGGNVLTGATNNLARVQALSASALVRALIADFDDLHTASAAPWPPTPAWFRAAVAALNGTTVTGGILAYLAANPTVAVSQDFADLLAAVGGYAAVPALQILDAKQRVAALTLAPPGAGTLATGTALGAAHTLELVAGTTIGPVAITGISVTGTGGTGTTESLANVPANTARGTVVATTTGTYTALSAIAAAGGTKGDVLVLRSSVAGSVRTPAL